MNNSNSPDLTKIMEIANSDAGRKLLELIRNSGSPQLLDAEELARSGNYSEAAKLLSPLLNSPQASALMDELRGM